MNRAEPILPARVWYFGGFLLLGLAVAFVALMALVPRQSATEPGTGPSSSPGDVAALPPVIEPAARIEAVIAVTPPDPRLAEDIAAYVMARQAELPAIDTRATQPSVTLVSVSQPGTNLRLQHRVDLEAATFELDRPMSILPGLTALPCEAPSTNAALQRLTPNVGTTCFEAEQAFVDAACGEQPIGLFLRRGAVVEYAYVDASNRNLGVVELTSSACGAAM